MRAFSHSMRMTAAIWLAGSAMLWGQAAKPPSTRTQSEQKAPELAPGTPPLAQQAAEEAKASIRPEVLPTPAGVDPLTYVIGPEDILAIRVWKEPELTSGVQVRSDGKITMNLIGEIEAAGKTPEGLKQTIVSMLSEYINKPEVTVSVQSVQSKKYYVTGEVNRTGSFQLIVPITVLQALINAGGFKEFANTKKINIMRNGQILKFNYKEVVKGKHMEQNVLVQNGDYIIVN